MKNTCYIISLLAFLLTGCSTYTIKNYQSKEIFYQDFNNAVKNRDVNITTVDFSYIDINDGIVLINDTLISYEKSERQEKISAAVSDIKDIYYTGTVNSSASILFKNGDTFKSDKITTTRDSISFIGMKTLILRNAIIPIDKVKTVSYQNRVRSLPSGLFIGAVAGLVTATIIGSTSKDNHGKALNYYVPMPIFGALFGAAIASSIGWNTTYQFNTR
jgi:hypothetical protein